MTDIDLTEAVEEAAKSIMSEYEDGLPSWRDLDSQGQTWYRGIAKGALEAALPLILAQVEARVNPSREDVAKVIWRWYVGESLDGFDKHTYAYDREKTLDTADAVLALLPGKTEQEVRGEIAEEIAEVTRTIRNAQLDAHGFIPDTVGHMLAGYAQAEGVARGGEGR